jgi:hypothetical protein
MNTHSIVIVSGSNKQAAQDLISALYTDEENTSTHGDNFFGIELAKGSDSFWASAGSFYSTELTALVNSGLCHHVSFDSSFDSVIEAQDMAKVVIEDEPE